MTQLYAIGTVTISGPNNYMYTPNGLIYTRWEFSKIILSLSLDDVQNGSKSILLRGSPSWSRTLYSIDYNRYDYLLVRSLFFFVVLNKISTLAWPFMVGDCSGSTPSHQLIIWQVKALWAFFSTNPATFQTTEPADDVCHLCKLSI